MAITQPMKLVLPTVRCLLASGQVVARTDGIQVLQLAAMHGRHQVVSLLISAGVPIDITSWHCERKQ